MKKRRAIIRGTGMYVPAHVYPNSYFDKLLGEDVDTWLKTNVQIYERRWTSADESTADLAANASMDALKTAGIDPLDLDLIILATDTPEFVSPSTATVVQERIGAANSGTFDINAACAGFVTALDMGAKYIESDDQYQNILVIGAYNMSKFLNLQDKKTVTLFADGAGAVVLKASTTEKGGLLASKLESKGQYNEWMGIYSGGARNPLSQDVLDQKSHLLQFVKKFPKELNPQAWSNLANTLCRKAGIDVHDISRFFITQININSIHETLDILGVSHDRAEYVMHNYGYTGSACIPMALDQAVKQGKVKKGDLCMFIGSGGGLAFAAALYQY
jgi:3-oxoacyl-[acyl-carrier-protein] synthase-3